MVSDLESIPEEIEGIITGCDQMRIIGLIVNPIAGMGGRVGLKGTDGKDTLQRALAMGASAEAPEKTIKALEQLLPFREQLLVLTCSGKMGEDECIRAGLACKVVHISDGSTDSDDTISAGKKIAELGAELILFSGGDGTARDMCSAVGLTVPVLGIPAGVKIHSPVYGNTPEASGKLARAYLEKKPVTMTEEEVIDIDEDAYRHDRVLTRLYGYLMVPVLEGWVQSKKAPTPLTDRASQMAIALDITDNMIDDICYIIGPGSTTKAVMDTLGLKKTLLGVDIVKNRKLVGSDCNEANILDIISESKAVLVITPTGGQGYLLGRGNQQISPKVLERIKKNNIIIIAVDSKLIQLRGKPLLVYTGDAETDAELSGYYKVRTGYGMSRMYKVEV